MSIESVAAAQDGLRLVVGPAGHVALDGLGLELRPSTSLFVPTELDPRESVAADAAQIVAEAVATFNRPYSGRTRLPSVEFGVDGVYKPLTIIQREVLVELSSGTTRVKAGDERHVTENTTRSHSDKIRGQLGAGKSAEAVAKGIVLGDIVVEPGYQPQRFLTARETQIAVLVAMGLT